MGKNFGKIVFEKHRLHEDGVHGLYHIDEDRYVSVCTGGGSYGDMDKIDYWVLLTNKHDEWTNNLKSTFEVAFVNSKSGEIEDGPYGNQVEGKLTVELVEQFIEKVKQEG